MFKRGCSDFVIRLGFGWGGLVAAGWRLVLVIDVLLWALVLVLLARCFLFAGGVFGFVVLLECSLFGFMLYCVWLVIWVVAFARWVGVVLGLFTAALRGLWFSF